jgi:hypothetical protein
MDKSGRTCSGRLRLKNGCFANEDDVDNIKMDLKEAGHNREPDLYGWEHPLAADCCKHGFCKRRLIF